MPERLPLTERVRRGVDALFDEEDRESVARLMEEHCGASLPGSTREYERIRCAVLKLSGGDLDTLEQVIQKTQVDWRDVLMGAGFGNLEDHLNWDPTANREWLEEAGNMVLRKKAQTGDRLLSLKERLIYCLWVADRGMRCLGTLNDAQASHPSFQEEGVELAQRLSLRRTAEMFALSQATLEKEYLARIDRVCAELRRI